MKGKERKLAIEAANALTIRNTTTTGGLLRQAEVVASSKRFRMPQSIGRVLKRAISTRTKCATWFKQTEAEDTLSSSQHSFFIDVLRRAGETLTVEKDITLASRGKHPITAETDTVR